jgi:hypothetical protein
MKYLPILDSVQQGAFVRFVIRRYRHQSASYSSPFSYNILCKKRIAL